MLLIGAAGLTLAGSSAVLLFRRGPSAAEKERQRLLLLHRGGRLIHGEIEELRDATAFYRYEVSGVSYTAAQDLSAFPQFANGHLQTRIGQVIIKYDRANPSNSMIHCDQWSGLRSPARDQESPVRI